jgi:hypothetical protein
MLELVTSGRSATISASRWVQVAAIDGEVLAIARISVEAHKYAV